ncbi:hypothetical protein DL98DRAFT_527368 [Cadophora sp. DSE1049]|nr:hypothetical protein DL98DRAFT_527368 [Cadophora sp. DSE1049]
MGLSPTWLMRAFNNTANDNDTIAYDGWFYSTSKEFRLGNMICMIVELIGIIVSNACGVSRISSIPETNLLLKLTVTHVLVLTTYLLGSTFCVAACLLYFDHTVYNQSACHAAIILSPVFYLGQNLCLYLFLVERTHGVQANARPRKKYYVYLASLAFVLDGFTAIVWALFIFHVDTFNITTGICQIGLARPVASALLGWDVLVKSSLTAVFIRCCKPYMVWGLRGTFLYPAMKGLIKKLTHRHGRTYTAGGEVVIITSQDALMRVIQKVFWGCLNILDNYQLLASTVMG